MQVVRQTLVVHISDLDLILQGYQLVHGHLHPMQLLLSLRILQPYHHCCGGHRPHCQQISYLGIHLKAEMEYQQHSHAQTERRQKNHGHAPEVVQKAVQLLPAELIGTALPVQTLEILPDLPAVILALVQLGDAVLNLVLLPPDPMIVLVAHAVLLSPIPLALLLHGRKP